MIVACIHTCMHIYLHWAHVYIYIDTLMHMHLWVHVHTPTQTMHTQVHGAHIHTRAYGIFRGNPAPLLFTSPASYSMELSAPIATKPLIAQQGQRPWEWRPVVNKQGDLGLMCRNFWRLCGVEGQPGILTSTEKSFTVPAVLCSLWSWAANYESFALKGFWTGGIKYTVSLGSCLSPSFYR